MRRSLAAMTEILYGPGRHAAAIGFLATAVRASEPAKVKEVVFRSGDIEPQAMKLLVRLAAARGEVVPKEGLLAEVWEGRAVVETGSRPRVNLTQPRRGYRLGRPTGRSPEPRAVEAPIRLEPKLKTKILIKTGPDAELATSVPTAGAGPAS